MCPCGKAPTGKGMTAQNLLKFLSAVGASVEPPPPEELPKAVNAELQAVRLSVHEVKKEIERLKSQKR